jgi:uncharacterized protein YjdB
MGTIMNRRLPGTLLTAFAFCLTISCSDRSKSGPTGLALNDSTVAESRVASATVTLAQSSLVVGQTTQATARLLDRYNNLLNLSVVWSSSDTSVATVSGSGLVTAKSPGTVSIIATRGYKSGAATLTVVPSTPPPVASVTVSPASSTLQIGATVQLQVSAFDANNNPLTGRVVTSSSADPGIASINSLGLVTAVSAGTTQMTVTSEGKSAIATITVSASAPPPTNPSTVTDLHASVTGSSSATLSFTQVNDGTGQPAKYDVRYAVAPISWGSASSTTSGTCSTPVAGTATGGQFSCTVLGLTPATNYSFQLVAFRGTMNLNAVYGSLSNTASATTTASGPPPPVPVTSVSVTPTSSTLQIGATVQLQVTAFDANNNVLTGRVVTSSSANPAIASVNSLGLVTAVSAGTTQITVTSEGKSANATIIVSAPAPVPVASVSVSPATSSMQIGAKVQLLATVRDANNNVLTGRVIAWSSGNTVVASVTGSGLVTAVAAGSAQITATSEGKSGNAAANVSAPPPVAVASVGVTLASGSLNPGQTTQATAITRDANNNILTGRAIAWSSSNTSVVTVSGSGAVTAVAAGSAQITATSEGKSGSAGLSVVAPPPPPPPGSIEPPGMARVTERSFSAVAEDGWTVPTGTDLTNFTVVSDATAPKSAPLAMQIRFPAGFGAGNSPALTERDLGSTASTLYVSMWIKLSSNWVGQITGTNKVLHFWMAGLNRLFVFVDGAGNNILQPFVGLQGIATPYNDGAGSISTSVNLRPNVVGQTGAQIVRGQWYHWELVFAINSSGSTDGTADWWINGVQVGHYTGIGYVSASQSRVFETMKWDPTWGGLGGTVPADQFMTMDHIYISGKP